MGPKDNRQGKLVGDSPELCRAQDSHGFADLDAAVAFCCSLASADTSPAGVKLRREWRVRRRAVGVHGEDVVGSGAYERARGQGRGPHARGAGKIIATGGCVVPDEFLRTGRRAVRAGGKGMMKNKRRKRQKIATEEARPHHPGLNAAYALLENPDHARNQTFA